MTTSTPVQSLPSKLRPMVTPIPQAYEQPEITKTRDLTEGHSSGQMMSATDLQQNEIDDNEEDLDNESDDVIQTYSYVFDENVRVPPTTGPARARVVKWAKTKVHKVRAPRSAR